MPGRETNHAVRRTLVALFTTVILSIGIGVPAAIAAPVPRATALVSAEERTATAAAAPQLPSFGSSAIAAEGIDGLLASRGPQTPRRMASITKVITALVVLQKHPLTGRQQGPTIRFTERDVAFLDQVIADNGSWEPVQAGWHVRERAALATMLIPSANNYAASLAVWAYGSMPAFLTAARAYLKAHDLDGTTLVDANGLGDDRSTPADLVALGRLAMADPVLAGIVGTRTADEPNVGQLTNTNLLLGHHGVDGLKTGTYDDGANLLFTARVRVGKRTVRLVGVVLGAKTHDELDAKVPAMLASTAKGLHDVQLAVKGQAFATYRTSWGGTGRAVATEDVDRLVWDRTPVQRRASVKPITGGRKGEPVGTVVYRVAGEPVTVPLALDRDVLAAPVWWRLTHPLR